MRAELPEGLRLYDATRHTFATTAAELEVPRDVRQLLMGHAVSRDAHDRYVHAVGVLLRAADLVAGELSAALRSEGGAGRPIAVVQGGRFPLIGLSVRCGSVEVSFRSPKSSIRERADPKGPEGGGGRRIRPAKPHAALGEPHADLHAAPAEPTQSRTQVRRSPGRATRSPAEPTGASREPSGRAADTTGSAASRT